jgi:hypothetical protein
MAKSKRGRNYKMTPRRQAALRKAQAVSARSRRRRVGRAAALVGGTLAVGAVAYAGHRKLGSRPKRSKALVHVPGKGTDHTQYKKTVIPKGWGQPGGDFSPMRQIKTTPKSVFKVNSSGIVSRTTKTRMVYDLNRRREYWQAKPVGGAPRKKYTSKKRGRS